MCCDAEHLVTRLPMKGAATYQHMSLVTYFNSVLVGQALDSVHSSDMFIYYIAGVVCHLQYAPFV